LFFILAAVAAVEANSIRVAADSCSAAQLGFFITAASNYSTDPVMVVPVLVKCSFSGVQLFAVGDVHDTSTNTDLGLTNTILVSAYDASTYSGQLGFLLSPRVLGHTLQISVYIYGDQQKRSLLASAAENVQINPSNYYAYQRCFNCNYTPCQSADEDTTTQCSGYLYQDINGCVEIVIPIDSAYGGRVYQYYTLQNLPSTYPLVSSWVTVTGHMHHGHNVGPNGATCPGNYISVTSINIG
jgi:hypothetical protein